MGKVSLALVSGIPTISLHKCRHDRQTAAQATTCFLSGHALSLPSTRFTTSRSSSGGREAHRLCSSSSHSPSQKSMDAADADAEHLSLLQSKLRLEKLPIPSRRSRTMLFKDMIGKCFYLSLSLSLWKLERDF